MHISYDSHAQAVRDRQHALRREADLHRLIAGASRLSLAGRLRCAAARLRLPVASHEACGKAASAAAR
jgi:hypothetical protein